MAKRKQKEPEQEAIESLLEARAQHVEPDPADIDTLLEMARSFSTRSVGHSHADVDGLLELVHEFRQHQQLTHDMLRRIADKVRTNEFTMALLCDLGFICREVEEAADANRKDWKAHKELISKALTMLHATWMVSSPETAEDTVKGELASATPITKIVAEQPARDTAAYAELMAHFYVPERVIGQGILKTDWKAMNELCTRLVEDGQKLPPGIGKTWKEYPVTYRRKPGLRF